MKLSNETKYKLRELKLPEVIDFIESNATNQSFLELSFENQLELMVDQILSIKQANRIKKYIRGAKFSISNAVLEDINYESRNLNKREILSLGSNAYIEKNINLIISGPTGCGKTYLACALGNNACRSLIRTCYVRMPTLLETVENAKLSNRLTNYIAKYGNYDLLIIDEWLLRKINNNEINILLEILEKRINKTTIFCTQYDVGDWIYNMKETPVSEAIISRVIDCSIKISLGNTNMRAIKGTKTLKEYNNSI
ncbi:MAG: ATP-binding protein [Peptostreptococcaceae bacterium]|nr:ATP-binding protein [Peptostreptococcaceae bacterium]